MTTEMAIISALTRDIFPLSFSLYFFLFDQSVQNKIALTESLIKDKLENVRCALRNTYPIWSIDGNDSMDKCFNAKAEKVR